MRVLCVIPARIGSRRLPHKPLSTVAATPLIRFVAERVLAFDLADAVVVATDDARVLEAVADLPVGGTLTDARHGSGTERVAEVAGRPEYRGMDAIVNVQGDEPFLPRAAVVGALARLDRFDVGTAAGPLDPADVDHPDRVKVVVDADGRARGFARRLPAGGADAGVHHHLGVYAYTPPALEAWVAAPSTAAERRERLEQLRAMEHGLTIGVALLPEPVPPGIDTEDDLRRADLLLTARGRRESA